MDIKDLIESAYCCDLKECNSCPSRERTACRERTMHELAVAVERLQKENEILKGARKVNCIGCDWIHQDNGNCTAVGGFCTAVPAAHCPLIPKLRKQLGQAKRDMADALRDLLTVCEHPASEESRSEKTEKWRDWLRRNGGA